MNRGPDGTLGRGLGEAGHGGDSNGGSNERSVRDASTPLNRGPGGTLGRGLGEAGHGGDSNSSSNSGGGGGVHWRGGLGGGLASRLASGLGGGLGESGHRGSDRGGHGRRRHARRLGTLARVGHLD